MTLDDHVSSLARRYANAVDADGDEADALRDELAAALRDEAEETDDEWGHDGVFPREWDSWPDDYMGGAQVAEPQFPVKSTAGVGGRRYPVARRVVEWTIGAVAWGVLIWLAWAIWVSPILEPDVREPAQPRATWTAQELRGLDELDEMRAGDDFNANTWRWGGE